MSTEFEVGGCRYRFDGIDAMTQFHVLRKFGPAMRTAQQNGASAIIDVFSQMTDADSEFVVNACMNAVKREQPGGGWAPVWNTQARRPMFEDLNAVALISISSRVMEISFASFFPSPGSA